MAIRFTGDSPIIGRVAAQADKIITAFVSTQDVNVPKTVTDVTLLVAGKGTLPVPADSTQV